MNTTQSRPSLVFCTLLVISLAGCGKSGPEIVPVTGTVSFGGGSWPAEGSVLLTPYEAAPGEPIIPTIVGMAKDGSFTAESTVGAGLVPGKYRVAVECWQLPPDESRSENPDGKSFVPAKYRDPSTSGLSFDLPAGSEALVIKFEVPRSDS